MRNTLKYDENKVAFEPKHGRTYEKYRFEKVFLIRYLFDYLSFIENNENMRNEMKKSFSGRNKSKFIMVQH